jgi:hypothetical protein
MGRIAAPDGLHSAGGSQLHCACPWISVVALARPSIVSTVAVEQLAGALKVAVRAPLLVQAVAGEEGCRWHDAWFGGWV